MTLRVAGTFLLIALLAGCSTPPKGDVIASKGFEILQTMPASDALDASDLYPFEPMRLSYRIVEPEEGQVTHTVSPAEEFDAEVMHEAGEERTEFRSHDDEGNVVLVAVIEHGRNALTLFDPPLEIAPPQLSAGQTLRDEVRMRVVDVTNRQQQRQSGTAVRTIEYVDDQRIRTPEGDFVAKHVVIRFEADLSLADAENVDSYWVVPGEGVVAMQLEEQIRVFGVLGNTSRRLLMRD